MRYKSKIINYFLSTEDQPFIIFLPMYLAICLSNNTGYMGIAVMILMLISLLLFCYFLARVRFLIHKSTIEKYNTIKDILLSILFYFGFSVFLLFVSAGIVIKYSENNDGEIAVINILVLYIFWSLFAIVSRYVAISLDEDKSY